MGWQDLHPLVRRAYQSKGGSVHKAKGFASMDKNRHLEVSSLGGKNKSENKSSEGEDTSKDSAYISPSNLEEILTYVGEDNDEAY